MKFILLIVVGIAVAITVHLISNRGPALPQSGEAIASEAALEQLLKAHGYTHMGRFSPEWPAVIVDVQRSQDGITFAVNGQSQGYEHPSYVGYDFIFYRFVSTKKKTEFGYLFKTQQKVR
ncbi:MAG: hypothetical protein AAB263_22460 [Planctomycetota bacterium]